MINESDLEAFEYYNQDEPPTGENHYLIVGRASCGYCDKAKDLLDDLGFQYDYKDYFAVSVAEREYLEEVAGAQFKTVPQIFSYRIGGGIAYIGGYHELVSSLI